MNKNEDIRFRKAFLYFIYLPRIDRYKIGITKNKEKRFKVFGNVTLLHTMSGKRFEIAYLEGLVLYKLQKYITYEKLLTSGNTEVFKLTEDKATQIVLALEKLTLRAFNDIEFKL